MTREIDWLTYVHQHIPWPQLLNKSIVMSTLMQIFKYGDLGEPWDLAGWQEDRMGVDRIVRSVAE